MTAVSASPAIASFPRRGWVQSPGWDAFWMFSALWGGALLLLGSLATSIMPWVLGLLVLQRALSVIHSWSTTWMVMGSSLLSGERRANRLKYAVIPARMAASAGTCGPGGSTCSCSGSVTSGISATRISAS
jgi:hypothetical protein